MTNLLFLWNLHGLHLFFPLNFNETISISNKIVRIRKHVIFLPYSLENVRFVSNTIWNVIWVSKARQRLCNIFLFSVINKICLDQIGLFVLDFFSSKIRLGQPGLNLTFTPRNTKIITMSDILLKGTYITWTRLDVNYTAHIRLEELVNKLLLRTFYASVSPRDSTFSRYTSALKLPPPDTFMLRYFNAKIKLT